MTDNQLVLASETAIVWLEDPLSFTYLREGTYLVTNRPRGRIRRFGAKG